jgi:pectinesterase
MCETSSSVAVFSVNRTSFSDCGREYFLNSYIQCGVDFIFSNVAAVFDNSEIQILRPGYLTAQSRVSAEQKTGYVLHHARITTEDLHGKFFYLGRPWRPFSRVVFLDCAMPLSLSPRGWSPWTPGATIEHTDKGRLRLTSQGFFRPISA